MCAIDVRRADIPCVELAKDGLLVRPGARVLIVLDQDEIVCILGIKAASRFWVGELVADARIEDGVTHVSNTECCLVGADLRLLIRGELGTIVTVLCVTDFVRRPCGRGQQDNQEECAVHSFCKGWLRVPTHERRIVVEKGTGIFPFGDSVHWKLGLRFTLGCTAGRCKMSP